MLYSEKYFSLKMRIKQTSTDVLSLSVKTSLIPLLMVSITPRTRTPLRIGTARTLFIETSQLSCTYTHSHATLHLRSQRSYRQNVSQQSCHVTTCCDCRTSCTSVGSSLARFDRFSTYNIHQPHHLNSSSKQSA